MEEKYFGPRCPMCHHPLNGKKCYHCGYDREEDMKNWEGMGCTTFIITVIGGLLIAWIVIEVFLKR